MRPTRIVPAVFITLAGCGTLVQVVDEREAPIAAACVQLIYPSFNGQEGMTDVSGYTRLRDSWFNRPLFSMVPASVWVSTAAGRWSFAYPPPPVLQLDPERMEPHHQKASQQDAAADERCSAARG
jgi:hypothetical protein